MSPAVHAAIQNSNAQVPIQKNSDLDSNRHHQQLVPQAKGLQQQQQQQQTSRAQPQLVSEHGMKPGFMPFSRSAQGNLEIASPMPQGHRQNPSETLQKEIDEAESHLEPGTSRYGEGQNSIHAGYTIRVQDTKRHEETTSPSGHKKESDPEPSVTSSDHPPGDLNGSQDQPQQEHDSKVTVSKLNVNAPEFKYEPKKSINPGFFAFRGDQQPVRPDQSNIQSVQANTGQRRSVGDGPSHPTKFNVEAPEFTPRAPLNRASVPSREFSFSASMPTFKPNAPASRPGESQAISDQTMPQPENPVEAVKKIFGEIRLPESTKNVKPSQAIPIIKPRKSFNGSERSLLADDGQEDESGRITQADGRQKRVRRDHDDGDQVPLFASPNTTPWIDQRGDDRAAYFSTTPSPRSEKADASTLEAATDLLEEIIDDLSATEASDLMREDDSVSEDGKPFQAHAFHDIDDAVSFDAARPPVTLPEKRSGYLDPTPNDVAEATMNFLAKSPQFKASINQAIEHHVPDAVPTASNGIGLVDGVDRMDHASRDIMAGVRYVEPSYNELDAIMRHLNEDSDRGVERQPSPFKRRGRSMSPVRSSAPEHHHSSTSPIRDATRELYENSGTPQLVPPANLRSDAPSPSPNRLHGKTQYLPQTDSESADSSALRAINEVSRRIARNPLDSPSWPAKNAIPVHHLNSRGSTPPSDWNEMLSSQDEDKFHSRASFFDTHVDNLVGDLKQRLGHLEQALPSIQDSLAAMPIRSGSRRPHSSGAVENLNSDADDEEDNEGPSQARLRSPLRDRKFDQLRLAINDIVATQQNLAPAKQLDEMFEAVKDLKASMPRNSPPTSIEAGDIRAIVEEAVGKQLRGRKEPITSSSVAAMSEKSQMQISGLETMLKIAEDRASDELKARRSTEDTLAEKQRLLRTAVHEAAEQRESAEATERTLEEFSKERHEMLQRNTMLEQSEAYSQKTISDLSAKNAALEDTLAEYRLSSDQWRTEIDDAKHENKGLYRTVNSLQAEIDESNENRRVLRIKFDHLQEEMNHASQQSLSEQSTWRCKEQEHHERLEIMSTRLEAEARTRERLEQEIEPLEVQEKDAMRSRMAIEEVREANAQLQDVVDGLRSQSHEHQTTVARFEREVHDIKESNAMDSQRTRMSMQADIDAAESKIHAIRKELEEAKFTHISALQEVANQSEANLQEKSRLHEKMLKEVKVQHERALNNALEDRERSETYFGNRLNLADERIGHYQERISHLEERLEIAKSAVHAAVQAAQNKNVAAGVVSNRSLTSASAIPEKISPQALRESILVLQEQLQERESRIEQLESELSAVDTAAPAKLKDAGVEITWLRELLGVRLDDLQDIITTLSQPLYDREAVKDAAIRLKANLQMEQQEKERALAGGQNFPSLASISNLAASPKALPLAAAAAWGNWRKGRESFGNLGSIANGSVQATPSKSSPQSFFAGLMTPPSTNLRTTPPIIGGGGGGGGGGTSRPLSSSSSMRAVAGSPTTPRQQSSSTRNDSRFQQQDPVTPPLMRKASYDLDASESVSAFGDEGVQGSKMAGEEDEEPFGPRLGGIVGSAM